jgi:uncharacterized protein
MTDKQALLSYRLDQAGQMLADAQKMLATGVSPRSVVNRAYYAMFYAVMGLFIETARKPRPFKAGEEWPPGAEPA